MIILEEILTADEKLTFENKKISDFKEGDLVDFVGNIKVEEKEGKTKYLIITISNGNGSIKSAVWENDPLFNKINGNYSDNTASIQGKITVNKSFKNIKILGFKLILPENDDEIIDENERPLTKSLKVELEKRISDIEDTYLSLILKYSILNRIDKLIKIPFSEKTAYAYKGGLVHQMLDISDYASAFADKTTDNFWSGSIEVDYELLITGALISNLGKSVTLKVDDVGEVVKTKIGMLEEDSIFSRDIAVSAIKEAKKEYLESLDEDIEDTELENLKSHMNNVDLELLHMVSSVKNNISWGALSTPRSKHAMFLAQINQLAYTKGLFESIEKNNSSNEFTKAYENGKRYYIGEQPEV